MNYLNLTIQTLTGPEFLGSEPLDRATWICLMRYCAQHETSGIIPGAAQWGDRKWMQLCGVTKDEVKRESDLWSWDGETLVVAFYPLEQETVAKTRRESGKRYGKGRAKMRDRSPDSSPNRSAKDKDKDKDKEKKEKSAQAHTHHATPEWSISDYVTDLKQRDPSYQNLNDAMIANILQCEPDPAIRAKAYNDCMIKLIGSISAHPEPLDQLRRYISNARRFASDGKKQATDQRSWKEVAAELEEKRATS